MTAVAILREESETSGEVTYRAIAQAGGAQSIGRTAGEALDALTTQLGADESSTIVVVQQMRPDRFFTEAQTRRLRQLMDRSHHPEAPLTDDERAERDALIEAELLASGQRAAELADVVGL